MKKIIKACSVILCITLIFSMCICVNAQTQNLELPEMGIKITLPENSIVIPSTTKSDDEVWEQANISDPNLQIQKMQQMSAVCLIASEDGNSLIFINSKESESTKSYFNLSEVSETDFKALVKQYNSVDVDLTVTGAEYNGNSEKFIEVSYDGLDPDNNRIYEHIFFTIVNGKSILFSHSQINEEISEETVVFMKQIVDTLQFNEILPKPTPNANGDILTSKEQQELLISSIIFLLMLITMVVSVTYVVLSSKRRKKEKVIMTASLSNYHQDRTNGFEKTQEIRFTNKTIITDEMIAKYSKFQSYRNKPMPYIISLVITLLCTLFSVFSKSEWWLSLVFVLGTGYVGYKFASSSTVLNKSLKKFYSNSRTPVAYYTFYDKEFKMSGIQKESFHPYFQISELRHFENCIYFYFGEKNPHFIDVSQMSNAEIEEFKKFISKKTKRKF